MSVGIGFPTIAGRLVVLLGLAQANHPESTWRPHFDALRAAARDFDGADALLDDLYDALTDGATQPRELDAIARELRAFVRGDTSRRSRKGGA